MNLLGNTTLRKNAIWTYLCHRALSSISSTTALNIALITGSTRKVGPPNPIIGPRVASFITKKLEERGNKVTIIDPNEFTLLEQPEFSYRRSDVPKKLQDFKNILMEADAYVCVTPEYNHAPSPGLVNVLNHFGSSVFSFKPSAIVSYSAGQWGGTRAAIALRPILSELGALPVSAMINIPNAQDVFDEDGNAINDPESWNSYSGRCFSQLEWWANAASAHKSVKDPFAESKPLQSSPSQRNAPGKT
ncbi:flavo protein [Fragilariopsis cylindrus CCMP1102]|uniref:Flavo protein n=1 Tax=Fragilariopsis cylindrus CCMP1102 TaxID=635003 RepID=A0A1E7EIY9_9STRA|nr:flavo protein [Fragilariopsis cylindrus CCMP1102]|eukprot:OEU05855.1 flavo protein [Fragilariopsis cylindrus CCMP1102]